MKPKIVKFTLNSSVLLFIVYDVVDLDYTVG